MSAFRPVVVGALYPGVERGLAADVIAARSLGGLAFPVCTSLVMAGHGVVTDATDVPEDTVAAQLEHLSATVRPTALKIGVLSSLAAARVVLRFAAEFSGPVLLDLQLSGPSGETVLTSQGIKHVMEHLGAPDLVVVDRLDAEPLSGGEINSLDDAQVAAQRLAHRGARALVIKCGVLPGRHFEEGIEQSDIEQSDDAVFNADLYFDGQEFALFEAPHFSGLALDGASSAFALAALRALAEGRPHEEALREAKRFVSDVLRGSARDGGGLRYFGQAF